MALDIEYSTFFKSDLPAPSQRWSGFPEYNFIGGHNDAESIPVDDMIKSISEVLKREGKTLATYGLQHGPQGYKPLRQFISKKVNKRSGLSVSSDDILITSGSGQALDLINAAFCNPGDTVIVEQFTYGSAINRLRRIGVKPIGVPVSYTHLTLPTTPYV